MSNYYSQLVEKIERQNLYAVKDKMEIDAKLKEIAERSQSQLTSNGRMLKALVLIELARLGSDSELLSFITRLIL